MDTKITPSLRPVSPTALTRASGIPRTGATWFLASRRCEARHRTGGREPRFDAGHRCRLLREPRRSGRPSHSCHPGRQRTTATAIRSSIALAGSNCVEDCRKNIDDQPEPASMHVFFAPVRLLRRTVTTFADSNGSKTTSRTAGHHPVTTCSLDARTFLASATKNPRCSPKGEQASSCLLATPLGCWT